MLCLRSAAGALNQSRIRNVAVLCDPVCTADIRDHNRSPKPFVCTKAAATVRAKLNRLPVASD